MTNNYRHMQATKTLTLSLQVLRPVKHVVGWAHTCLCQGLIVSISIWLHSEFLPLSTELQRGSIWSWEGSIWWQWQRLTPAAFQPPQCWRWATKIMTCTLPRLTGTYPEISVIFIFRFTQWMKRIKWNLNLHQPKQRWKKTSMTSSGAFLQALLCFSKVYICWWRTYHLFYM